MEHARQHGDDPDGLAHRLPRHERGHQLRDDEHDHHDEHLRERAECVRVEPGAGILRQRRDEHARERDRTDVDERGELEETARRRLGPIDVPHEQRAADRELDHEHAEDERERRERHLVSRQPNRASERAEAPVRSIARWKYSLPSRRFRRSWKNCRSLCCVRWHSNAAILRASNSDTSMLWVGVTAPYAAGAPAMYGVALKNSRRATCRSPRSGDWPASAAPANASSWGWA